jgi:hypothetical protein
MVARGWRGLSGQHARVKRPEPRRDPPGREPQDWRRVFVPLPLQPHARGAANHGELDAGVFERINGLMEFLREKCSH